jgi:hypothetical protein
VIPISVGVGLGLLNITHAHMSSEPAHGDRGYEGAIGGDTQQTPHNESW